MANMNIDAFLKKVPQLAPDKANHFVYGTFVFVGSMLLQRVFEMGGDHADNAFWVTTGFAVAKEVVDLVLNLVQLYCSEEMTHGDDPWDAVATAAGGGACWTAAKLAVASVTLS